MAHKSINCREQYEVIKEILKTKRPWSKMDYEDTLMHKALVSGGNSLQKVLLPISWECPMYGKAPPKNQHQDQTKLRLHNFYYYKKINK